VRVSPVKPVATDRVPPPSLAVESAQRRLRQRRRPNAAAVERPKRARLAHPDLRETTDRTDNLAKPDIRARTHRLHHPSQSSNRAKSASNHRTAKPDLQVHPDPTASLVSPDTKALQPTLGHKDHLAHQDPMDNLATKDNPVKQASQDSSARVPHKWALQDRQEPMATQEHPDSLDNLEEKVIREIKEPRETLANPDPRDILAATVRRVRTARRARAVPATTVHHRAPLQAIDLYSNSSSSKAIEIVAAACRSSSIEICRRYYCRYKIATGYNNQSTNSLSNFSLSSSLSNQIRQIHFMLNEEYIN